MPEPLAEAQPSDGEQEYVSGAGLSVGELFEERIEIFEPGQASDPVLIFMPAQLAAIQDIVSSTVQAALSSFPSCEAPARMYLDQSTPSPRSQNVATPLGLNHPLDKSLKDKILSGEYVDFCLLLPDMIYQSQSPTLQLCYEESSPDFQGFLLTLVKQKKPVIDSFQKWLDAFTTYMLAIFATYPNRSVELIKYQQIISRAVSKFKGLAWLSYDEQFRQRTAYDLSIPSDKIVPLEEDCYIFNK